MPMNARLLRPTASGFDPRSVAELGGWYDASYASSITLNGSSVSGWADRSGRGNNLTQAIASSQPAYNSNNLNGKPVVTFDGNDFLFGTGGVIGLTNFSLFAVFQFSAFTSSTTGSPGTPFGVGTSGQTGRVRGWFAENAGNVFSFGWAASFDSGFSPDIGNYHTWTTINNGNGIRMTRSGSVSSGNSSGNLLSLNTDRIYLGGIEGTRGLNGHIAEAIVYYTNVSTSAAILIERYLASKWGLSLT